MRYGATSGLGRPGALYPPQLLGLILALAILLLGGIADAGIAKRTPPSFSPPQGGDLRPHNQSGDAAHNAGSAQPPTTGEGDGPVPAADVDNVGSGGRLGVPTSAPAPALDEKRFCWPNATALMETTYAALARHPEQTVHLYLTVEIDRVCLREKPERGMDR